MNLKERKMLYKIYELLNAVPGAHQFGSTQTVTISGVANFAADMSELRSYLSEALSALFDGGITTEEREQLFGAAVADAEAFIARRNSADWARR